MMKKAIFITLSIAGIIVIVTAFVLYRSVFGVSVNPGRPDTAIYIPTGAGIDQVMDSLERHLEIRKPGVLRWISERKGYPALIKPGRYVIKGEMSSIELINMLRSGRQAPVRITFNNVRTLNQLAGRFGKMLEADSLQILNFLNNESNYINDGFNHATIISLFIPDTYEFYWNSGAEAIYKRMLREYRNYWTAEKKKKAESLGLDPIGVSILASIIDDEVAKKDEKPRIAGVYLNRLKRGIPLQACPTIKFALNDFTITRVLYVHLETDSPYNTYKHKGLPPGPVGCPSKEGIEAVLNAEEHDYLFFAAKSDFSGYHNFSRTLQEHNRYANQYQRELDRRRIFK